MLRIAGGSGEISFFRANRVINAHHLQPPLDGPIRVLALFRIAFDSCGYWLCGGRFGLRARHTSVASY